MEEKEEASIKILKLEEENGDFIQQIQALTEERNSMKI